MTFRTVGLVAAFSLILAASVALAHHSFDAEYDAKKPVTVTGIVTKVDWVNPHAYVSIDSKDDKGTVRNFKIEMGPPYALVRSGWKRETLKIGDKITVVDAALAKDGSNAAGSMRTTYLLLDTGEKMVMR